MVQKGRDWGADKLTSQTEISESSDSIIVERGGWVGGESEAEAKNHLEMRRNVLGSIYGSNKLCNLIT